MELWGFLELRTFDFVCLLFYFGVGETLGFEIGILPGKLMLLPISDLERRLNPPVFGTAGCRVCHRESLGERRHTREVPVLPGRELGFCVHSSGGGISPSQAMPGERGSACLEPQLGCSGGVAARC